DGLAIALQANHKHTEAAKYFDDAIRLLRELQPRHAPSLPLLVSAVAAPAQPPGQRWNAVWQIIVAGTAPEEARRDRALLADSHLHRGNLRLGLGERAGAAEDLQNALPLYERLHAESLQTVAYQVRLAEANNSLGVSLANSDPKRSLQALGRAIALLEPLANRLGHVADYRATLAHACRTRAVLRLVLLQREQQEKAQPSLNCGRPEDSPRKEQAPEGKEANEQAERDLRRAAELLAKLAAEYRLVPEYRTELIAVREMLAFHTHNGLRDPREAVGVWQDLLADIRQLPPKFRTDPQWRVKLAIAYDGLAQSFSAAEVRRIQDASETWQKALDVAELLVEEQPNNQAFWKLWVNAYLNRIAVWKAQARTADAERDYRGLVPILEKRARKFSEVSHLIELAHAHHEWALLLRQRNRPEEADRQLKLAVTRQREVVAKAPADACQHRLLCVYQLTTGEDEAVAETVSAWVKAVPEDRQPRYHEAARCLAQCAARAAKQGKNAEPLARRAIELLRKAAGQDLSDARFLSKTEFDVLREREDFKQVERSLEKPK
ncbi:MAG TPA: hypothetical protein VKD72_27140, partial [Gemmataceae bacterium]|nr:hypothetical protein [Gemmataceae bacterium]